MWREGTPTAMHIFKNTSHLFWLIPPPTPIPIIPWATDTTGADNYLQPAAGWWLIFSENELGRSRPLSGENSHKNNLNYHRQVDNSLRLCFFPQATSWSAVRLTWQHINPVRISCYLLVRLTWQQQIFIGHTWNVSYFPVLFDDYRAGLSQERPWSIQPSPRMMHL